MRWALELAGRYLRARKRSSSMSLIAVIAVLGVGLGVASLVVVLAISTGFQKVFQDRVLGVNAHVVVLKYGRDFEEYREVQSLSQEMPEVRAAAPFVIQQMMLSRGGKRKGNQATGDDVRIVLLKGVTELGATQVLDVQRHLVKSIVKGRVEGLRVEGTKPPVERPSGAGPEGALLGSLDEYLMGVSAEQGYPLEPAHGSNDVDPGSAEPSASLAHHVSPSGELPTVAVPTLEDMTAFLEEGDGSWDSHGDEGFSEGVDTLPSEVDEAAFFEQESHGREVGPGVLPGLLVGVTLAEEMGLGLGDEVQVVSPLLGSGFGWSQSESSVPQQGQFRVTGIFEAGFQEYDSGLVYADLREAQHLLGFGDVVTGVELKLHDPGDAEVMAGRLDRALQSGPFHTVDWRKLNHSLFRALELQKIMLSIVIATIIVVAAFCVIATLILSVLEKKKEIAILKSMGARPGHVLTAFAAQGAVIGVLGTGVGLLLGGVVGAYLEHIRFPLDPEVYLIDHLPVQLDSLDFVVAGLVALGICFLATLIPSRWASRLIPVDGLRAG